MIDPYIIGLSDIKRIKKRLKTLFKERKNIFSTVDTDICHFTFVQLHIN